MCLFRAAGSLTPTSHPLEKVAKIFLPLFLKKKPTRPSSFSLNNYQNKLLRPDGHIAVLCIMKHVLWGLRGSWGERGRWEGGGERSEWWGFLRCQISANFYVGRRFYTVQPTSTTTLTAIINSHSREIWSNQVWLMSGRKIKLAKFSLSKKQF